MPDAGETILKDPDATLDYGMDWSDWLAAAEVIDESAWSVQADSGLVASAPSHDDSATLVWLAGGSAGNIPWRVTNRITTDLGRTEDRSFFVRVTER